jgi:hypothetical protein
VFPRVVHTCQCIELSRSNVFWQQTYGTMKTYLSDAGARLLRGVQSVFYLRNNNYINIIVKIFTEVQLAPSVLQSYSLIEFCHRAHVSDVAHYACAA